jgi:Uri superfamily endonuclease
VDTGCLNLDGGIYFLIKDGMIMYVGQAKNIVSRIIDHRKIKQFDRWSWIHCDFRELDHTERAYINALQPPWNKDGQTVAMRKRIAA